MFSSRLPRPLVASLVLGTVFSTLSCEPELAGPEDVWTPDTGVVGGQPSLVFVNGRVITMNPVTRVDEAIAIRGPRIVRTGTTEALLRFAGPKSTVVDLEGRTVMPGFVDAHSHYFQSSWQYQGRDFDGVQDLMLLWGTTTVGEPSVSEGYLPTFLDWVAEGRLKVRTNLYLNAGTDVCGNPVSDWWKSVPPSRTRGDRLWIAGVKMFGDGGACNLPAVTVEFEPGGGYGDLYLSAEEVAALVSEADALGYQVLIHSLGDRSLEEVLDGYEMALGHGNNRLRHRIEHNNVVRPDQLHRYSEIGVLPVVFGHNFTGHLEYQFLGATQGCPAWPRNEFYQAAEAPLRKIIDANPGLPVSWHADNPPWPPNSPIADLHNMVTREQVYTGGLVCPPDPWMLSSAISVEQALEMMTVNAAFALHREHEVGSLAPGKFADLLVLSDNPLTVPGPDIRSIKIFMTMINGHVEYCRDGADAYCPESQE